jgi:hypothetical protein
MMTIKTILAAGLLAVAPSFALAMGCSFGEHTETTAMTCAEGAMLDEETGTCVPVVTG